MPALLPHRRRCCTHREQPSALLQLALVAQESYGSLASVFEGISGWGRAPAGANTSALPYYAAAAAQLQLPPVFGLWLNPATSSFYALNASQAPVPGGYVTLGGYARSMFADNAPPSWVPLASAPCSTNSLLAGSNLWCVQVQGVAAAGYSAACSTGAPCSAAVDSTNPSIVADPATMAALLSAMGLSNLASMSRADAAPVIYCSNIPTLPSLTLTLNGSSYELPAAAYTRNMSGICTLQLNSSAALSPGQLVLGQPWLRWYATVFDASVGRIGFGPAAGRPAPVPPPASLASVTFRGRYTPDSGDKYTMDVVIGTPAQTITNVVVDSGSQVSGMHQPAQLRCTTHVLVDITLPPLHFAPRRRSGSTCTTAALRHHATTPTKAPVRCCCRTRSCRRLTEAQTTITPRTHTFTAMKSRLAAVCR